MFNMICVLCIIAWFLVRKRGTLRRIQGIENRKEQCGETLKHVQEVFRKVISRVGVTVQVEGMENLTSIPKDEAVMFIGNHRSWADVVIGYTVIDRPTAFIAKDELKKIKPIIPWMEVLHCQFMVRNDMRQSLKVILEAIRLVKEGISVWIYPEGTRAKGETEEDMLPFKDGSFKIAQKSGCKIVPIAMLNTRAILEDQLPGIRGQYVRVRILEPIEFSKLTADEMNSIGEYARQKLLNAVREMRAGEK